MAEVINLNRFRKARKQAEDTGRAAVNRVRFGRDKAEKDRDKVERDHENRELEDKKLD